MAQKCEHLTGCVAEAEHAVWTTRTAKTGEVKTTIQWAFWQDEKQPPKKADLLCETHAVDLVARLAQTMGGGR